jgi:acylphosphatase
MLNLEMVAIVKGKVQRIGFRAKTKYYADQLALVGYVGNLPDGSVKICAQGPKEKLEELIEVLRKHFGSDKIQDIAINFTAPDSLYDNFGIIH